MAWPMDRAGEEVDKKTSANPGEGTGIIHWLAAVSQSMVVMLRVPRNRPSTVSWLPRV